MNCGEDETPIKILDDCTWRQRKDKYAGRPAEQIRAQGADSEHQTEYLGAPRRQGGQSAVSWRSACSTEWVSGKQDYIVSSYLKKTD